MKYRKKAETICTFKLHPTFNLKSITVNTAHQFSKIISKYYYLLFNLIILINEWRLHYTPKLYK